MLWVGIELLPERATSSQSIHMVTRQAYQSALRKLYFDTDLTKQKVKSMVCVGKRGKSWNAQVRIAALQNKT